MYVLHGIPDWGSQVVHLALAEIGQPFEFRVLNYDAGDLDAPGYRALNPFGLVPTLQTPDGPIFETTAILLYLSQRHGALAPKPSDADWAPYLTWLIFVTNQLHPTTMVLLHPQRPGGEGVMDAVADHAHDQIRAQLAALDAQAATGVWWLSGPRPSMVSLFSLMLLRWIKAFAMYPRHSISSADYPALHAMAKGLEARAAIRMVMDAEGISGPGFSDPAFETKG
jgi:glutathione S-transferase